MLNIMDAKKNNWTELFDAILICIWLPCLELTFARVLTVQNALKMHIDTSSIC